MRRNECRLSASVGALLALSTFCSFQAIAAENCTFDVITINSPIPRPSASFGFAGAAPGDLNGDAIPDLLIGGFFQDTAFVLSGADGSLLLRLNNPDRPVTGEFGRAVARLGDLDADAVPDLLIGGRGGVHVLSGASGGVLLSVHDPAGLIYPFSSFGVSVASPGDADNDGFFDLLVGDTEVFSMNQGQAFLFSGKDGTLRLTLNPPPPSFLNARFGFRAESPGDVNGDGTPDLFVGAPGGEFGGMAFVFNGSDGALIHTLRHPTLPFTQSLFGANIAAPGDVNGDGVPDLLVGAVTENVSGFTGQGRAYLFSGMDGAVLSTLDDPNPQTFASFGRVAAAGDLDADGVPDLLVGADAQDVPGFFHQGQVFVFSGANAELATVLDHPDPQSFAGFGLMSRGVGDVNGDGMSDLMVGAPNQDVGLLRDAGEAFLFRTRQARTIGELRDIVECFQLDSKYAKGLLGKLDEAQKAVDRGNTPVARNKLTDFIGQVEGLRHNQLSGFEAQILVNGAERMILTLSV